MMVEKQQKPTAYGQKFQRGLNESTSWAYLPRNYAKSGNTFMTSIKTIELHLQEQVHQGSKPTGKNKNAETGRSKKSVINSFVTLWLRLTKGRNATSSTPA